MVKYPLEQVLAVKRDRVEKAEKVVEEKKRALKVEQEKLEKLEAEMNRVLDHHSAKLAQLRHALDTGTTSDEVLQMKAYLKTVKDKLEKEKAKVKAQTQVVKTALRNLELAREELKKKRLEEEKILLHKEQWVKEMKKEINKKEAAVEDEIGQVLHESKRRVKKEQE